MTASERKDTSHSAPEGTEKGKHAENQTTASRINGTVAGTRKRFERETVRYRQPLLDFTAAASPPASDDASPSGNGEEDNDQAEESEGLFGYLGERKSKSTYRWRQNGFYRPPPRRVPTLFDFPVTEPAAPEPESPPKEVPRPVVERGPAAPPPRDAIPPAPSPAAAPDRLSRDASPSIASGEKGKARDILATIRVLKSIDEDGGRLATTEERQILSRFAGFGPVALSIFPDPITGRFKDGAWQSIGQELRSLLSPEEYDSAKRTTFNAFYTSPTVITAMHDALHRLGVPENGTVLEPGCGSGNFMTFALPGMHFIGIELD